jgi:hypothetical protein
MVAANFQETAMRKCISCLALGILLVAGTLNANGQTRLPTVVAQAPVTVPPSGVLATPPPALGAVPPSGVLIQPEPVERRTVTTVPVKTVQPLHTAERVAPATMRRYVVHRRTAARRGAPRTLAREDGAQSVTTTRTTTIHQRIVATPVVVTTAAAAPAYVSSGPRYYNFVGRPMVITPAPAPSLARQRAAPAVNSAAPVVATPPMPAYRYVYEADRILVIDLSTNLAVQAIPR